MNYKKGHQIFATVIMFLIMIFQVSCTKKNASDLSRESIIPKPVSVTATGDYFTLKPNTTIYVKGESSELFNIGHYLADRLRPATGFKLNVKTTFTEPGNGSILLTLSGVGGNQKEGSYELVITKKQIRLSARTHEGLFYGVQTLRQLFPAGVEMTTPQEGPWKIATGTITDYPEYSYRGSMLDVARHFFSVDDVRRYIDFLAYYKMNMLHLHLSDDQGWRIEIKSWPKLTEYGSSTQVGGGKGGFYTQEQYSAIVDYAKECYITIVPEIDMPGHTNAALASYPELNCDGKAKPLYTGTEVGFSTLCINKEITYKFIDDVIRELAAITPGPYIHIGGDESHSTKVSDYIPFMERVQDIVAKYGKSSIGWDEIALSVMRSNTIAQHWSNAENADKAVRQGAKLLMSPANKAYIDMQYDKTTKLGLHWAAYIEVDAAYNWDPASLVPGIGKEHIVGVEAPLWAETLTNIDEIEYMVFPRLPGIAEIGWTPVASRSWDEYKTRLGKHGERFEAMEIDYYRSPLVTWSTLNK
ncbi:MAG TPA: beta-N-acetylhexosaminidase [Bacteroidales bacterium]|nr:beta-N-acetylhexosaminidase [Bacteroidales bacterium]HPM88162.1 beta-N-acetylhexosaminidase [Bacteroidales bacterium]